MTEDLSNDGQHGVGWRGQKRIAMGGAVVHDMLVAMPRILSLASHLALRHSPKLEPMPTHCHQPLSDWPAVFHNAICIMIHSVKLKH